VDFSRDILSLMHGELKICAYPHHGYWEDVGSLKDYYAANMALAADVSVLALFLSVPATGCSAQCSETLVWQSMDVKMLWHITGYVQMACSAAVMVLCKLISMSAFGFNCIRCVQFIFLLQTSRLQLFDREAPLYSEARVLPPSKVYGASVADSLVGDACRIEKGSVVKNSVIGSCAFIGRDCFVKVGVAAIRWCAGFGMLAERLTSVCMVCKCVRDPPGTASSRWGCEVMDACMCECSLLRTWRLQCDVWHARCAHSVGDP
jgi:NDP-sugar pyrophosphorylase family protein